MPTGGFAGFMPASYFSGNAGANATYLTQVIAQQNGTATAILIDYTNAASGLSLKAVVYDGSHSALLATGSTVASVVAGYNRFPLTANLSITAGTTYYVGYVCNSGVGVSVDTGNSFASAWNVGGGNVASPANPLVGGATSANCLMVALEYDGTGSQGFGYSVDQSAGVTLSSSNTVATFASTAQQGARSLVTLVHPGVNYYAEVAVSGATIRTDDAIGVAGVAWNPHQNTPASSNLFVLQASGIVIGIATPNLGLTWGAGDVIGLAVNLGNNYLWWNKNNGSWFGASSTAGNPATGSNPYSMGGNLAWPMSVIVLSQTAGTSGAFTLRDSAASLQYTPPSGFVAWSPYVAPVITSQARAMVLA